ncbi:MAG: DUF4411 family protein [Moraxellaceae bacterium]|nr:DUF4411 family protein [Moraxellaceae bacterium]
MYLYDTNVISELRKYKQNDNLKAFHQGVNQREEKILISAISYGEVLHGIQRLRRNNDIAQANVLQQWYDTRLKPIEHLAVPFDIHCAKVWGNLLAVNPHNQTDKQLVATALVHDLILVTRNVKDIANTGVRFINPFVEI